MDTLDAFEHVSSRGPSVSMSEELSIDALWDKALVDRGFTDPRNGAPSIRALAAHLNVGPSTISNMRAGATVPKPSTVQNVADALGIPVTTLSQWIGQQRALAAPYVPPDVAHLLTQTERDAVDGVIRAFAEHHQPQSGRRRVLDEQTYDLARKRAEQLGHDGSAVEDGAVTPLAARKGESRERKRRRLEVAPEDQSQDPGDDQ
jgi:transcriptional regulator with XRE-family HTH domain